MIKVSDYTKIGFSENNAKPICRQLESVLENEDVVTVDFADVNAFTTLFFNNSFGKFFLDLGPEEYGRRIKVTNLSETGSVAYEHFLSNAKQVFDMRKNGKMDDYASIIEKEE